MLTIYIHRKKVADIICMVYAMLFSHLVNVCNQMRAYTFDMKWTYVAFGLTAVYFLALYIFTQICDWKMAAINLVILIVVLLFSNPLSTFLGFWVHPDFATIFFMLIILCHRGYQARKQARASFQTEQEGEK